MITFGVLYKTSDTVRKLYQRSVGGPQRRSASQSLLCSELSPRVPCHLGFISYWDLHQPSWQGKVQSGAPTAAAALPAGRLGDQDPR